MAESTRTSSNTLMRAFVVLAFVSLAGGFFHFDLQQYLTLDYLRESRGQLQEFYVNEPVLMLGGYFVLYVLATALSLPGAAVLSLAGGGLFGLTAGVLTVSFASTIGATLAMLLARFLLQDWVQNRFGEYLRTFNEGIEREGGFYLFGLRLVPAFPFFAINLVMGLTPMRAWTFFWVSQLGMLPGTVVYINAGSELGKIQSMGDILSPGLIGAFVLLGLFPLAAKRLVRVYTSRRQVSA